MNSSYSNINLKLCAYGFDTRIYWDTNQNKPVILTASTTTNTKQTYYSKKPWNTQPKPKMSNSFELLTGPIENI
ncbi:MAG: hypothetical protein ACRD8K_12660 [Nitrososphaeraceae archaeon]